MVTDIPLKNIIGNAIVPALVGCYKGFTKIMLVFCWDFAKVFDTCILRVCFYFFISMRVFNEGGYRKNARLGSRFSTA